jgi:hypothetical protein
MHYMGTCFDENVLNTLYDVVMEGQGEAAQPAARATPF